MGHIHVQHENKETSDVENESIYKLDINLSEQLSATNTK